MSANPPAAELPLSRRLFTVQVVAWVCGLLLALVAALDLLGLDPTLGIAYLLVLAAAPACWMMMPNRGRIRRLPLEPERTSATSWTPWLLGAVVVLVSVGMNVWTGVSFGPLPPAYHDEYSYLFQARTFLAGRLWFPSHPQAADLFDQMHVLNEGRFASRYFPGAGLWIAPFLAAGHPWCGHWLASGLSSLFIFLAGRELGGNRIGFLAGLITALSPGMALFGNLLLAHQPTMVGLSVFLFAFLRMQRGLGVVEESGEAERECARAVVEDPPLPSVRKGGSGALTADRHASTAAAPRRAIGKEGGWALAAGVGLSYAMICRPPTAAGFALPFGIWFAWWLVRGGRHVPRVKGGDRLKIAAALGAPILAGLGGMFLYNQQITGDGWTAPYQLYTDIYTPRHVYGFDNVVRGEQRLGPKVIENYDRWAENLTPSLAVENTFIRLLNSWHWTLDILPLAMATIVFCGAGRANGRWWLVLASIVSLHALHVPYWFVGIMGWHYVFETGPLWALVFARATQILVTGWRTAGHPAMPAWWGALTALAIVGADVSIPLLGTSRLEAGIGEVAYSRRKYAEFDRMIEREVTKRPALVLIEADPADRHIDYVVNDPALEAEVLFGRYRPERASLQDVRRIFPERTIYLYRVSDRNLLQLQ